MLRIVTSPVALAQKCHPVGCVRRGGQVARRLFRALELHNRRAIRDYRRSLGKSGPPDLGIGLAAPQIGEDVRVCVVRIAGTPLVLMDPIVVACSSSTIPFTEGCLSFPGKKFETWRHIWVEVESLNRGRMSFGPRCPEDWDTNSVLWSVAVQHEIAHLAGLVPSDFTRQDDHPSPLMWFA
jgi:peptide deformylase